jgi:serine/threonine protein kinase
MAKNTSLEKGAKLNDYIIQKRISAGGFSIVYLGYHKDGTPVAIKEFFPNSLHLRQKGNHLSFINMREKQRFQEGMKGFKKEMEIITKIKHPNVIEIINYFEIYGTAYIVMPYEYGMTLGKYIAKEKNKNEADIIKIVEGVFSAIKTLHDNDIIHLDLKPGNIWLRPNKEALILDFGTARMISEGNNEIAPMYTPGYAAPEQHREYFIPQDIGYWTDYYALGATLYALIEKETPIPANDLKKQNASLGLMKDRYGQYSNEILSITELLMNIDVTKRKEVNLQEVIEYIRKIKPITNNLEFAPGKGDYY